MKHDSIGDDGLRGHRRKVWSETLGSIKAAALVWLVFLVTVLAPIPWRESLGMLYGYWALGWLALTVLAFSAILVRSLMEQRRIYLRDRADR